MVYIKRLLKEAEIENTSDLTGTVYINQPAAETHGWPVEEDFTIMVSRHEGYYMVGFYELEEYVTKDGEKSLITKDMYFDDIYFSRPDSCVMFIKNYLNTPYRYNYPLIENLEEWKAETDELHKRWLLQKHPEYIEERHKEWLQRHLIAMLQKELK